MKIRLYRSTSYLPKTIMFSCILTIGLLSACKSTKEAVVKEEPSEQNPVAETSTEKDVSEDMTYLCTPQKGLTPVCGFASAPEDMEWLPDGSMLVSEYGTLGAWEGRISLYQPESGVITPLYGNENGKKKGKTIVSAEPRAEWGEAGCVQQDYFSPHGISLSKRADGRLQLLVVNHAPQETIEFFEVLKTDSSWELAWRGCVAADDNSYFNDVAATSDGFYTTRFFAKDEQDAAMLDYMHKRKNGHVKKWSPDNGWQILTETAAVGANGLLWNPSANELVVAEWADGRVNVHDGDGHLKHSIDLPWPDNISWSEDRQSYLVATKRGTIEMVGECSTKQPELCPAKFTIYELFPNSKKTKKRYFHDGSFFGMASNAVERDGKFYIGSWIGSRMLIADVPESVE